jgi:hypothetical protein
MPYRLGGSVISLHDTACRSANLNRTAKRTSAGLLQRPTLWYAPAFGKTVGEKRGRLGGLTATLPSGSLWLRLFVVVVLLGSTRCQSRVYLADPHHRPLVGRSLHSFSAGANVGRALFPIIPASGHTAR